MCVHMYVRVVYCVCAASEYDMIWHGMAWYGIIQCNAMGWVLLMSNNLLLSLGVLWCCEMEWMTNGTK